MPQSTTTVARLISDLINGSKKQQNQIAEEVGFDKPNIISMIKSGKTKLPKIARMARALDVDPLELLILCLKEYQPDNWAAIEPLLDLSLSSDERRLIHALRTSVGRPVLTRLSDDARQHLAAFLNCLRSEAQAAPIQ